MGCANPTPINRNPNKLNGIVALIMMEQNDQIIEKIKSMDLNEKLNHRGDRIIHYIVKRGNKQVLQYLLKQPKLKKQEKNNLGKTALEMTEDETIIAMLNQ